MPLMLLKGDSESSGSSRRSAWAPSPPSKMPNGRLFTKLKGMRELALSSGKQVLPFLLLIGFSLLGSLSFCLLVRYNEAETHLPDGAGPGVCVDAYNASFVRAFYFTSTVFSSIGYGDVVPCTWAGKLVTMSLALMGVPLTLFCLGRLGSLLRKLLDRLWRTLACHYCRNGSGKEVEEEDDEEARGDGHLPLTVGIIMTLSWILLSSAYFVTCMYAKETEPSSWNYFDAVYFTIISLFTIGFGDYAPLRRELTPVTFGFIFVGLSLVSMCVSIAQRKMENQFDRIVQLIQKSYEEGAFGKNVNLADLTGKDAKVAGLVLKMWSEDPNSPMALLAGGSKKKKDMRMGKMALGAVMATWKAKTIQRQLSVSTQANMDSQAFEETETSIDGVIDPLARPRKLSKCSCNCHKLSKQSTVSTILPPSPQPPLLAQPPVGKKRKIWGQKRGATIAQGHSLASRNSSSGSPSNLIDNEKGNESFPFS